MISFKLETISPTKASKMLAATQEAGFNNRGMTKSFVSRYAHDMENGHWQPHTGETIKVTKGGVVIDGQHRLTAIIQSGATVRMWVCRDIDEGMFQYIDQGKQRDLMDIMTVDGWTDPRILAVTAKMLWRCDRSGGDPFARTDKFSESDGNIYDWVLTVEPDLRLEWQSYKPLIRKIHNNSMKAIPDSLMFYCLYQWKKEDADAAHLFADYLAEDSPLAAPAHASMAFFKQYAIELKMLQQEGKVGGSTGRHGDVKEMLYKAADHAWQLIQEGRQVRTFRGFKSGLGQRNSEKAAA